MAVGRTRAVVAFASLAVIWGLTVTATEVGLAVFPPLLLSAVRFDLAGVLLLGYVVRSEPQWRPRTRADLVAISGGGLFWIAVGNGFWFVGQDLTTSVISGVMTSLIPVTTTAVSWVVVPEDRLSPASVVGLAVSFLGALVLFWPSGSVALGAEFLGKGLFFLGVIGTAVGGVLIRWAPTTLSQASQAAWSVLLGAALIHGLSAAMGESWAVELTSASLGALAYLVLPGTVVAYLLFFSLLEPHSAIEISLVTYLVPVVAATAGWAAFGEPLTLPLVAGFAIIVVGFGLLKRRALADEFGAWLG